MTKLFIFGFPKGIDDKWFSELFGQHGKVAEVAMVKDEKSIKNLGYGFIMMENEEDAERAASAMNGFYIEGCFVNVKKAI